MAALLRTEVPVYGSGRLGTLTHLDNGSDDYRYELTDQVGNARVIFHRPTTTVQVETMELNQVPLQAVFLNDDLYRVAVSGAPSGNFVARLTDSQPAGQELKRVLTVTRGDTITFSALGQWKQNAAAGGTSATPFILAGAGAGVNSLSQRGADGQGTTYPTNSPNWLSLLSVGLGFTLGQSTQPATLGATSLEGWIKYRVLDAQGNPMLDTQGHPLAGVDYLLGTGQWEYLQTAVRVPQNGTIEVTAGTSGTGEAVYFDNLRVEQTGGLIVQEQHQYTFGAPLPGLSYTVGNKRYRYGYQGQYAEHDSLTGFDSFELRMYNSRVGRWLSYDPEGQYSSPYVGMGNNPISRIDPTGGLDGGGIGGFFSRLFNGGEAVALNTVSVSATQADVAAAWASVGQRLVTASSHSIIGILGRAVGVLGDAIAAPGREQMLAQQRKSYFEANIRSTREAEAHGISDDLLHLSYKFNRLAAFRGPIGGTIPGIEFMSVGGELGAITVLGEDALTIRNKGRLLPEQGVHQVLVHGEYNVVRISNVTPMTAQELSDYLTANGHVPGTPIRLIACYTGGDVTGVAAQLAEHIHAPVTAPLNRVVVLQGGRLFTEDGIWRTFFPDGTFIKVPAP